MSYGVMAFTRISLSSLLGEENEQNREEQRDREGKLEVIVVKHRLQLCMDILFIQDLEH